MNKHSKKFAHKIIHFLENDNVIDYLNEIDEYSKLIMKIARTHDLQSRSIINDPGLEAEYDLRRESLIEAFKELRLTLSKFSLDKESLNFFYKEGTKIVKDEYSEICKLVKIASWFSALIRKHKDDKLHMTLQERIQDLKHMGTSNRQMEIAEITGMKNQYLALDEEVKLCS